MVELDRIYQHLFWQQHSKEIAQDMPTSEPMAAESTDPSREYVRKAGGLDKP